MDECLRSHDIPVYIARPLPFTWGSNSGGLGREDRSEAGETMEAATQTAATGGFELHCERQLHPALYTESWLHSSIPDAAIKLAGRTAHGHDRTQDSNKIRGGGLCIFVTDRWCTTIRL